MFKRIARWLLRKELYTLSTVIAQQEKEIATLQQQPKPEVRTSIRIPASEFLRFRATLPRSVVTSSTTDLQAAALVGQQFVLERLEQELVSG